MKIFLKFSYFFSFYFHINYTTSSKLLVNNNGLIKNAQNPDLCLEIIEDQEKLDQIRSSSSENAADQQISPYQKQVMGLSNWIKYRKETREFRKEADEKNSEKITKINDYYSKDKNRPNYGLSDPNHPCSETYKFEFTSNCGEDRRNGFNSKWEQIFLDENEKDIFIIRSKMPACYNFNLRVVPDIENENQFILKLDQMQSQYFNLPKSIFGGSSFYTSGFGFRFGDDDRLISADDQGLVVGLDNSGTVMVVYFKNTKTNSCFITTLFLLCD